MPKVKICGINNPATLSAAEKADMLGFVFYKKSPRHLTNDLATQLAARCAPHIERIALLVDPDDEAIDHALGAVSPHRIQLHGHETPERVRDIKNKFHRPIIKAFGINTIDDLQQCAAYENYADWFLFDAKPVSTELPGGNGKSFDWSLLSAYDGKTPWMLSGGLTPENVSRAILETRAPMVDVSSGVEKAPGDKDTDLITAFIGAAHQN
jgi:phosphoribosylanthranilate isomerase